MNIYEDVKTDINKLYISDYPTDNLYDIPQVNKKVLGLIKAKGVKAGDVKKTIDVQTLKQRKNRIKSL